MANVYLVRDDGTTQTMSRIRCQNEDRELQLILERNPDLLPGDQIDPEDPRRWLLIKREMPVPDPNTGIDRWCIDFMFGDQAAVPTFVECKRFSDTRSRREAVGQMLEYAANGHYYWNHETLCQFAREAAKRQGLELEDSIRALQPASGHSIDAYFERLQHNLREGRLRMVFFLEDSPMELRSVVDFLNKQMERSEVLLVEARQYFLAGTDTRIVVPTLFGFTEEARQAKRSIAAPSRKRWDRISFFADAESRLHQSEVNALAEVLDQAISLGCEIAWGTGQITGGFSIKAPSISSKSLLSIFSNGRLQLNFGWLYGDPNVESARETFKTYVSETVGLPVPPDLKEKYPSYPIADWVHKGHLLLEGLTKLIVQSQERAHFVVAADVPQATLS